MTPPYTLFPIRVKAGKSLLPISTFELKTLSVNESLVMCLTAGVRVRSRTGHVYRGLLYSIIEWREL